MKLISQLNSIVEMAFHAGDWTFKPNLQALADNFKNSGTLVTKLEGGKYSMYKSTLEDLDSFGLFDGDNLLSIAQVNSKTIHGKTYRNIAAIFTPAENRRLGYSMLLLFALKELDKSPLLFDDAIFNDGWALLNSIGKSHTDKFQDVKVLDKSTGDIAAFTGSSPKKHEAFIIENDDMGFYREYGFGHVYYNMFTEVLGS